MVNIQSAEKPFFRFAGSIQATAEAGFMEAQSAWSDGHISYFQGSRGGRSTGNQSSHS